MAHGVYPSATEMDMIAKNKVFIAHCPQSNANLASGIAPIREYMENGVKLGIGTDIAGGASLSMMRAVADTISVSKLRWRLVDESRKPLSVSEAFFMATKGGGELFGKVGSFEEGYAFDAIVLSDDAYKSVYPMSIEDRLERAIYLAHDSAVLAKYVDGVKIK
ncbi:MAG: amidohydrolase family protein, partial [Oscillospiraceae bacterium]